MNDITGQTANEARLQGAVKMAEIIYFIYLAGLIFPIAHVVGVVMAYINRGDGAPWVETHFRFQIRSFWILFLYCVIGTLLMFVGIGFFIILAAYVWFIIRCVKGLKLHTRNEPVPDPGTWLW